MPTTEQIANILLKNFNNVSSTEDTREFFEEPLESRQLIIPSQILSDTIPTTNPLSFSDPDLTTSGVVQVYKDKVMTAVAGTTQSFQLSDLRNSIAFNYGDGSYAYIVKKSGGSVIPLGEGDWIVNNADGTLTFYGTLPLGVSAGSPPTISFFKYIGSFGLVSTSFSEVKVDKGTDSDPTITFSSDDNTGIFLSASDTLGITAGGTEQAVVGTTGLVTKTNFTMEGLIVHSREVIANTNTNPTNLSSSVTISEVNITAVSSTGSLADGTFLGQQKTILIVGVTTGDYTLTVTSGVGGTYTLEFDTINQSAILMWTSAGWCRVGGAGAVVG